MAEKKKIQEKQKPKAPNKKKQNEKLKINGTLEDVLFASVPEFKK